MRCLCLRCLLSRPFDHTEYPFPIHTQCFIRSRWMRIISCETVAFLPVTTVLCVAHVTALDTNSSFMHYVSTVFRLKMASIELANSRSFRCTHNNRYSQPDSHSATAVFEHLPGDWSWPRPHSGREGRISLVRRLKR